MLALRSFLRRPNPLLTSLLRPVRRQVATHTVVVGRNLITPSRRGFSDATDNGDPHQTAAAAKKHLYLVLDDHEKDYGIYKLDVDLLDADVDTDSTTAPQCLPNPALIRMEVTEDSESSAQFAAAGSCIVATGCSPYGGLMYSGDYGIVTILYDIKRAAMSVSMHPTDTLQSGYAVAVPVGNRLYVLDSHTSSVDSFHVMTTSKDGDDAADGEVKQRDWGWYSGSGSSRIGWSYGGKARSWSDQLPFSPHEIEAHAVHPRDCTIFVSALVRYEEPSGARAWRYDVETFAYDTTSDGCWEWTRYGRLALPFKGHAHYDRQLNKWVGLHGDFKDLDDGTTGYLSACDVPSSEHKDCPMEPERTASMEKIFPDDPDRRRIDFKLVYMGERSEYCLFERLRREGADEKKSLGDGEECVLRLTTFRLEYECGEPDYLRIMDRRTRSYKVSRYRDDFEAQAFWI